MLNKYKYYSIIPLILIIGLWIRGCKKPAPLITGMIPFEDLLRVKVKDRVITVQTAKETATEYVPDHGTVVVDVTKEGDVIVDVKNKGLTLNPVLGLNVSDGLGLAAGVQFAYWNRFELYGGLIVPRPAGFIGLGYRLDQLRLNNTSIYVSYSTRKEVGCGVLLRF